MNKQSQDKSVRPYHDKCDKMSTGYHANLEQ
uniref:Uncharacterized protein n=1 Tax=Arundo donax TaxID=35708 RepID=A0A0A8ZL78_ARUDO